MGQANQRLFTATEIVWRVLRDKKKCACSFLKSTKEVFNVQGAWHSLNTLPTNVHGQAPPPLSRSHTHREGSPMLHPCPHWAALWVWALGTFTNTQIHRGWISFFFLNTKRDSKNLLNSFLEIVVNFMIKCLLIILIGHNLMKYKSSIIPPKNWCFSFYFFSLNFLSVPFL